MKRDSDKIVDAVIKYKTLSDFIKNHSDDFVKELYPEKWDEEIKEMFRVAFVTGFCDCFVNLTERYFEINDIDFEEEK